MQDRGRFLTRALFVTLGLCASLAFGEAVVRLHLITPARQIIRGHNLHMIGNVPVWEFDESVERENIVCAETHPERIRVAFFGNSISFGSGLSAKFSFTALLERRLNERRPTPGFCVMNFSQPGYRWDNRLAAAAEMIPRFRPQIALEQEWNIEWNMCHRWTYTMIGDSAYNLNELALRSDGFPGLPLVPDGINHALFLHSELYQYATLAMGEPTQEGECEKLDYRAEHLRKFAALAHSVGAKAGVYIAADLSSPLNEVHPGEIAVEQPVFQLGRELGFSVYDVRHMISDQDYKAIRMDGWHFNVAGQRVLAERFEPVVLELLDGKAATAALSP